jgi:tetratricopeptide (TPR) repeat protein
MLKRALLLKPNDPTALTLRGKVALVRGDPVSAERALQAAIGADQRYAPALMELANIKRLKGDCAGALPLYYTANESTPNAEEPYKGIGACQEALGRLAEAASAFRAAITHAPGDARATNSLAWVELMRRDNLPEALLLAKRASLLLPGDAEIIDTLGWAYFLNGQPDLAVPNLQTALDGLGREPTVHYPLGMALAALGRNAEAKVELEAALHAATNFAEAADARHELGRLDQKAE